MSVPLCAGDSPLQSKFVDGCLLMLRSIISGRNLRINAEGELDARGKDDREAHFMVHVHKPGSVSLQCVLNPEWWVAIYEGRSTGTGRGGPYCEFQVEEIGNNVVLISEACAGQWIGVLRDGRMKSPMETTLGIDAQFSPTVVDPTSSLSRPSHMPKPVPKPRARPRPQSKPAPPPLQSLDDVQVSLRKPIWIAPPPPPPTIPPRLPPPPTTSPPIPPPMAPPTVAPPTTSPPIPPLMAPPTVAPPTVAPPTVAPPTTAPPTVAPPTVAPPTMAPPTVAPPTVAPPTVAPPTTAPPTAIPPPIPPRRAGILTHPIAQQAGREFPDSSLQSQTHGPMRHPSSSSVAAVTETIAFSVAAVVSNQTHPQEEPWPEAAEHSNNQRQIEVELQVQDQTMAQVHSQTPEQIEEHCLDQGQQQIAAESTHDDVVQRDVTGQRQEVWTNPTQEAERPRVGEQTGPQNLELAVAQTSQTGMPDLTSAESLTPESTQASSQNSQTQAQVEAQHLQDQNQTPGNQAPEHLLNLTPEQSQSQNSEHSQNQTLERSPNQTPGRSPSLTSEQSQTQTIEHSQEPPEYTLFSPDYSQEQMGTQVRRRVEGPQIGPHNQRPQSEYPQHFFQQYPSAPMHPSYPPVRYSHFDRPFIPYHFTTMDAFRDGNQVWLISGTNGCPLQVVNCKLCGNGNYIQINGQFIVVVPGGTPGGVVMLQNAHWRGCYISIRGNKLIANGKGDNTSLLRVHVLPDNHVCFESAVSPGQFIGVSSFGDILPPDTLSTLDYDAQFRVRMARQRHPYSNDIVTIRGTPSIFKILRDRMIVQIYLKGQGIYLTIGSSGKIKYIEAADSDSTFFVLHDRGMGVVSLFSYKNIQNVLKIVKNGLTGRGIADLSSDFYVRENMDGTVSLESCTCSNSFVGIKCGGHFYTALSLKVVTIRKVGKRREITITAV